MWEYELQEVNHKLGALRKAIGYGWSSIIKTPTRYENSYNRQLRLVYIQLESYGKRVKGAEVTVYRNDQFRMRDLQPI